ncbi:sodium channel modifier 1 isoform X1 [Strigops habroptila]|uniref:sodium channel modifier 1 isoform X1 n=1 Tax=Strigops habroptila TaxID=2489341 RepID=UPI0011CEFC9A|nr:sodium channel modifier 1 isoform X1 [Strigops habroptila]
MSFKREGDDPAQLGVLQKRRVADLLANYIPEEEALLLRSGRYACMVCAHRPVFDTLDVLTVHRAGKKHMSSLQRFYGRKCSLQGTAQELEHKEEVRAEGSPAPLLARTRRIAQSALLKAAPYSSCCRRPGLEGSSSRAGVTRMGPSAAPMLPEPARKEEEAVVASTAAVLPGHRGGQADSPEVTPAPTQQSRKRKASSSALGQPKALSPARRQALEQYLRLRSAGWIRDRAGKWVKDENAEFDSDEEEPPLALLPA